MKKAVLVLSSILAFPCQAGELDDIAPSTQAYVRIPLGPGSSGYDRRPSFGLAFKNGHASQTFMLDSRVVESSYRSYQAGVAAGIEAQWLIVGAIAAGAAVAIASRTKAESNEQQQQNQQKAQQQQQQQQQQTQQPCPKTPPTC